jgi:hypothetical protein
METISRLILFPHDAWHWVSDENPKALTRTLTDFFRPALTRSPQPNAMSPEIKGENLWTKRLRLKTCPRPVTIAAGASYFCTMGRRSAY